ncbi:MAG: hypothetical protein HZB53_11435 [Chloroflexi bacterium]|nr:hypothetical protein [Chloroflexota bacterium]
MNTRVIYLALALAVSLLTLSLVTLALAQGGTDSQPDGALVRPAQATPAAPSPTGDDSNPINPPHVVIPDAYRSNAASVAAAAESVVYFTPQDENTSTTVLFLYNTNSTTATVGLQTYYINGSLTISTSVAIPPNGLVRICGDTVMTVSASWSNYVLVNFTTFSAYGKLTLPPGVKAEGYVAWDYTGVYDPLTNTPTLPMRFSQVAPGASTVYFTPQDENTSTTALFLYNTNPTTATVNLHTYYVDGSLTISTSVIVPPNGMTRISADTVTTVSASWSNYVLINFTTFSAYAKMTVPPGVLYDGYVAWDVSGIYDPLVISQTLPLRFSMDPSMVFLPSVQR